MRTPPQPAPVMPPIQNNLLDLFDSSANENPAPPPSAGMGIGVWLGVGLVEGSGYHIVMGGDSRGVVRGVPK